MNKETGYHYLRHYMLNPCFNYGMIPQTWENHLHKHKETDAFGDKDPLDIVEMSPCKVVSMGQLQSVKVLGSLCLIDQGELDWKILAINEEEAKLHNIRNIEDFNRLCPGATKEIQQWFRMYKTYEGKGEN